MKKSIFFLFSFFLSIQLASALDANISYCTFKSPSGNFIELYLHVLGPSAEFVSLSDSTVQAALEVVVLFKQGEEIVKFDKYNLNSPVFPKASDFMDLKRYVLENGKYEIDVSINDLNRAGNARQYNQSFEMNFSDEKVELSDIQLLSSVKKASDGLESNPMVKNGFYLEPLPSHFFDKNCERLIFYSEIYGADQFVGDNFLVSYFFEKIEGERKSNPFGLVHKRKKPAPVVPLILQADIVDLASGNYNLVVEVRSREGELLDKKTTYFQRSNPYLNASREEIATGGEANLNEEFVGKLEQKDLIYALKAITMQVGDADVQLVNTMIREKNVDAMRLYLFSFWAQENATNPELAYEEYMKVARAIDLKFKSGLGYGFETDRGYVFMKYGAPSDYVTVETDPFAPPYEIWFFNQFPQTGQNNVKFVFYNPSLVTNGFVMLHSTARGEVNNPRWEVDLYRDSSVNPDPVNGGFIDGTQMGDGDGKAARRIYDSF